MLENSSLLTNSTVRYTCEQTPVNDILILCRNVFQILLTFPVALYVLFLGFQRWKPQRSFDNTSHSDVFTYNMALTLLFADLGVVLYHSGQAVSSDTLERAGDYLYETHFATEVMVHCLTCVDRYLAIVHPIFYLRLKQRLGVVVRNVSVGIVWSLSLVYMGLRHHYYPDFPNMEFISLLLVVFVVVLFCSVSVLFALIRPAPGDKDRHKMDQSKLRALQTVMAIMVVVLVWVVVSFFTTLTLADAYNSILSCLMLEQTIWVSIPCSLVLPSLYVHRAGGLSCIRKLC